LDQRPACAPLGAAPLTLRLEGARAHADVQPLTVIFAELATYDSRRMRAFAASRTVVDDFLVCAHVVVPKRPEPSGIRRNPETTPQARCESGFWHDCGRNRCIGCEAERFLWTRKLRFESLPRSLVDVVTVGYARDMLS